MKQVKQVIGAELEAFEQKFTESVKSQVPLLDRIMKYIIRRKGKQMRPMFVFLSAKLFGPVNEGTHRAAALVELLHTATLVHDDVVDESMERRGFFSINAIWKNKIAVLVGDYLLSKGLLLATGNNDFEHLHILSEAVKQMSEGELLQIEKARKLDIDEQTYYSIIKSKTASLLASACAVGAYSTSNNKEIADKMRAFGEKTGIAFQIKDDLFDYGTDKVGKPTGNDIREKKMTLPLIYTLQHVDHSLRKKLIYIVKNESENKDRVQFVVDTVKKVGGIEHATRAMIQYRDEALAILNSFPQSAEKQALIELVEYTTNRNY